MKRSLAFSITALMLCAGFLFTGCAAAIDRLAPDPEVELTEPPNALVDRFHENPEGAGEAGQEEILYHTATENVVLRRDVSYRSGGGTGSEICLMDVCMPADIPAGETRPLVLVVHGGTWAAGNKAEMEKYILTLGHLGYIAAAINYRMLPDYGLGDMVEDVLDATRFLLDNSDSAPVDPGNIYLLGSSAGAQISLVAAYSKGYGFVAENKLEGYGFTYRGVIAASAPVHMDTMQEELAGRYGADSAITMTQTFLGGSLAREPSLHLRASPLTYITPESPPTLIVHGELDETVPVGNAHDLNGALAAQGVQAELVVVPGGGHGVDMETLLRSSYAFLKGMSGVGTMEAG